MTHEGTLFTARGHRTEIKTRKKNKWKTQEKSDKNLSYLNDSIQQEENGTGERLGTGTPISLARHMDC